MENKTYILKSNGKEVKIGEIIKASKELEIPFGKGTTTVCVKMTEDNIPILLEEGYIIEKPSDKEIPTDVDYYISKVANKLGWKEKKFRNYLEVLASINPIGAFNILLKAIAIELDKKYPNHISKSENIFIVSVFDGSIRQADKSHIKTYKHFSAFRTREDAQFALHVLKNQFYYCFNDQSQG